MGWRRFQTLQSQKDKDTTLNSDAGRRSNPTRLDSFSTEGSSRTSTYSTNTQKSLTFALPKWAGAARGVTMRILNNGENLMRELVEPPKWLTLPFGKYRRKSAGSSPKTDDNFTLAMRLSSSIHPVDQSAHGLVSSPTQVVSPTPTWNTLYMGHPDYEDEAHVPIFSGWASFCGAYTPPILVPRTHWDDTVAGNKQAKLDEMDLTTSVTVTTWKKQKEPVRTGVTLSPGPTRFRAIDQRVSSSSGSDPE